MFRDAKIGDVIYSYRYDEFGKIREFDMDSEQCIIAELKSGKVIDFDCDGREDRTSRRPTVFWDKIKFTAPERQERTIESEYRKLKKKRFVEGEFNDMIYFACDDRRWYSTCTLREHYINTVYFHPYYIDEFVEFLNEYAVTPEEFQAAMERMEY